MAGEYEDLYGHRPRHSWYDKLTEPAQQWIDGLCDVVRERGEPNWVKTLKTFKSLFPDEAPKTTTTIKDAVRRLLDH